MPHVAEPPLGTDVLETRILALSTGPWAAVKSAVERECWKDLEAATPEFLRRAEQLIPDLQAASPREPQLGVFAGQLRQALQHFRHEYAVLEAKVGGRRE
jgi:hypothetical protein